MCSKQYNHLYFQYTQMSILSSTNELLPRFIHIFTMRDMWLTEMVAVYLAESGKVGLPYPESRKMQWIIRRRGSGGYAAVVMMGKGSGLNN